MELSHNLLKICGCFIPKEFYTFHVSEEATIRINCDNEFFLEVSTRSVEGNPKLQSLATDYDTVKRMTEIASYGNVIVEGKDTEGVFRMQSGGLYIECPMNNICEEELCPPLVDNQIPFINVRREHLRKAFEIVASMHSVDQSALFASRVRLYIFSGKLVVQYVGVRITIDYTMHGSVDINECKVQTFNVDGAYLEFEKEKIEQIVRFLRLLHHECVKLHIHKDLIFRIVAGSSGLSKINVIQSRTVITFYCGHCV